MTRTAAWRFLRSRRLAIGLILAIVVYGVIGTIVPQAAREPERVASFAREQPALAAVVRALGLNDAFTAAPFLLVVALLALSTAVCAWERTARARGELRRQGSVAPGLLARLRDRPAAAAHVADGETALARIADEFGSMGLRVRRGPKLVEATGGRAGLFGSPVFHWSLTLLIVVIGLGQLTRAEGMIGVPVGYPVTDTAANYRNHHAGPLYAGHSGLRIEATDLVLDYVDGSGQPRGPAPVVTLKRGGAVVASGRVYPNAPLRSGALLIHMNDYGFSPVISLETSAGTRIERQELLVDRPSTDTSETGATSFELAGPGVVIPVSASLLRTDSGKRVEDLKLKLRLGENGSLGQRVLAAGETVELPTGDRLRLDAVTHYVRLSIADDWSVYPMYALFGLASAGLALAVLFPARSAWGMLVSTPAGDALHVVTRNGRGDVVFEERVREALRSAAEPFAKEEPA